MTNTSNTNPIASFKDLLAKSSIQDRLHELVGEGKNIFTSTLIQVVSNNTALANVDHNTIIGAALTSASLKLSINPNLGLAYIIPYKNKAQFQMGYKGFIQLAMRTNQVQKITASSLTNSQFKSFDSIKEELVYDLSDTTQKEVGYYVGYFKLINGFEKVLVLTKEEMVEHALKYSKSFKNKEATTNVWRDDFEAMAKKTVLKHSLSKYAPLSIDLQTAVQKDQAVLTPDGDVEEYIDNPNSNLNNEKQVNKISANIDTTAFNIEKGN